VRRLAKAGVIPGVTTIGRRYKFDKAEIEAWIASGGPAEAAKRRRPSRNKMRLILGQPRKRVNW